MNLADTFGYKMCIQLSFMHEKAINTQDFITKILDVKRQIQIGDPIEDDLQLFVQDIFDDIIRISQICEKSEDFGKFLYTNADIDAYISTTK